MKFIRFITAFILFPLVISASVYVGFNLYEAYQSDEIQLTYERFGLLVVLLGALIFLEKFFVHHSDSVFKKYQPLFEHKQITVKSLYKKNKWKIYLLVSEVYVSLWIKPKIEEREKYKLQSKFKPKVISTFYILQWIISTTVTLTFMFLDLNIVELSSSTISFVINNSLEGILGFMLSIPIYICVVLTTVIYYPKELLNEFSEPYKNICAYAYNSNRT
ncbi:hypothetical protein [Vibrio campbellii]|uniref:hypothetical protein n=1 Tax=Vibrio campbellii TaxID=680 RepID=UPI004056E261